LGGGKPPLNPVHFGFAMAGILVLALFTWILAALLVKSCHVVIQPNEQLVFHLVTFLGVAVLWLREPVIPFLFLALLCIALAVTVYTDYKTFFIFRICTLYLVPIGFLASALGFLPIGLFESLLGAGLGYGVLMFIKYVHVWLTGHEGLGAGDAELLAVIGAFMGPLVCWEALILGSFLGSLVGVSLLLMGKATRQHPLPLGACIALAAFVLVVTGWSPLASFLLV
jgi:leader peptidase (prepilin peptidase)/N-methyltransferase